jgi:hypothetical protein
LFAFLTLNFPLYKDKLFLSTTTSFNDARNLSLQSDSVNVGHNIYGFQDVHFMLDAGKRMGFNADIKYNYNFSSYSLSPSSSNQVCYWDFGQDGWVDFKNDFSFHYKIDYKINQGVPPGFGQTQLYTNLVVERRFYKGHLIVGASANDLFNENASYSHINGEGYVEDDRSSVLGRYFLLTLTWKFQQDKDKSSH